MAEGIFIFILFAVLTVLTALLFGGWLIVQVLRGVARVICRALDLPVTRTNAGQIEAKARSSVTCPNPQCRAASAADARFCRRCGQTLPQPQRVSVRRAAMW